MSCNKAKHSTCPFACTDQSETAQNYGCLPTPYEIIMMRVKHNKTWACHTFPDKPCLGAIEHLKENKMPHSVSDLVTEKDNWDEWVE